MGGWSVISCYRILGLLCTLFLWYKLEEDIMHYDTLERNPSSSPVRDWSEESRMFICEYLHCVPKFTSDFGTYCNGI